MAERRARGPGGAGGGPEKGEAPRPRPRPPQIPAFTTPMRTVLSCMYRKHNLSYKMKYLAYAKEEIRRDKNIGQPSGGAPLSAAAVKK